MQSKFNFDPRLNPSIILLKIFKIKLIPFLERRIRKKNIKTPSICTQMSDTDANHMDKVRACKDIDALFVIFFSNHMLDHIVITNVCKERKKTSERKRKREIFVSPFSEHSDCRDTTKK